MIGWLWFLIFFALIAGAAVYAGGHRDHHVHYELAADVAVADPCSAGGYRLQDLPQEDPALLQTNLVALVCGDQRADRYHSRNPGGEGFCQRAQEYGAVFCPE